MANIIVKVKINDKTVVPKFHQCLLNLLQESIENKVNVNIQLHNDHLLLSKPDNNSIETGKNYLLQHSVECPMKNLSLDEFSSDQIKLNIPVAVSIIIESSDHHILMTKRSNRLKASPGTWVPPGGHLDSGESLIGGGLREVFEETGLCFKEQDAQINMLGLWENVYPILLGFGKPKRHTLVIYYRLISDKTHHELNNDLKVNPNEVEAYAWLSPKILKEVFTSAVKESHTQSQYVYNNGEIKKCNLEYLKIFPRVTWGSKNVYSGVQFALTSWYRLYCLENNKDDKDPFSKM